MHRTAITVGCLVAALAAAGPATAADAVAARKLSQIDKTFLIDTQQANIAEIAAGRLALRNSSDPMIKQFAHLVIRDHTAAKANVVRYASQVGFTLPVTADPADAAQTQRLETMHGRRFDQAYMQEQEGAHRRSVALARQEVAHGTQRDIAELARSLVPILEHHLQLAKLDAKALANPVQSGELAPSR